MIASQRRQHPRIRRSLRTYRRCRLQTRRTAQRTRQRHHRRGTHRPGPLPTRNQQAVAARLAEGRIDLVTISGWGFLTPFLAFLEEIRFCALLDLPGQGFERIMIPVARLILTYQLKVLLGTPAMNLLPTTLFRERALLKLIGYTTTQLQAGACQRGQLSIGPMHKNTLGDAIERLTADEVERLLNQTASRLAVAGVFDQSAGRFALDASDLETTERYLGAGHKTKTEKRTTKQKQLVEVVRFVSGFKVILLYEVHLRLVVAAKVVPINDHESSHTESVIAQAVLNLGPGVIRILVLDAGFLDGETLWRIKHTWGIDFVIPPKTSMKVTAEARALCRDADEEEETLHPAQRAGVRQQRGRRVREVGQATVVGVEEVRSYTQYGTAEHAKRAHRTDFAGNALNAVVVTRWEGVSYPPGEEKVFLTSLPVTDALAVLDLYDLRSLIENTCFRELKQGWALESFPKKTADAVRSHVFLTLVTFTLINAFRTKVGEALSDRGVRRWRTDEHDAKVIIFSGAHYGIFDIEEVFVLLGMVPTACVRVDPAAVRRKYRLPRAA
jgi:hypothetical protein